jgi:O-antigen/teichoic acid export membrane protein
MQRLKRFLFTNQTTKQTVIKNTFWIASSTVIMKVIRAAIIIYAARILGTGSYGIFTYAMSLVGIFAIFSDMGLSSILTRELSKGRTDDREYIATSMFVKFGFILIVILAIILLGPVISRFDEASSLMTVLAFSVAFESTRNFLYALTRAKNTMQTEAGINIVTELCCTTLVVFMFFTNPTPYTLAFAYMIGNGIGLVAMGIAVRRYVSNILTHIKYSLVLPILRNSWPFTIMGAFGILMTNIDSVIIGHFTNEETLGLYGAAQRPISLLYIIPGFLNISLLSIISRFASQQKDRMQHLVQKTVALALSIGLPITVGGILIAQPFINVAFGYQYIGAVLTFQLLLVSLLFSFPGSMLSDVMLAENKQSVLIRSSILGAVTNVILDLLLIPRFGIAGSAVGTICAQLVANGIFFIETRKTYRLHLVRNLWKTAIATAGMGIFTWFLLAASLPLILIVLLAGALYIALLFVLKDSLVQTMLASFRSNH